MAAMMMLSMGIGVITSTDIKGSMISSPRHRGSPSIAAVRKSSPRVLETSRIGTLEVPSIGVGTIAWAVKSSEDAARIGQLCAAARDAGLTFIDTAERYGAPAASMIPAALKGVGLPIDASYIGGDCESNLARWGQDMTVATKFTPTPWRRSAHSVVEACEASAERLGVSQIPLYQIHMPDIIQPFGKLGLHDIKDEVYWDGIAQCYHQGLIANVGVSNYGPRLVSRAYDALARRGVPLASNQIAFNLLHRHHGSLETISHCRELGVAVLAYYPLAMGLLTGLMGAEKLRSKGDGRSKDLLRYLEGGHGGSAGAVPDGGVQPLLSTLRRVGGRRGKTPAQVSLNWILCKGAIPIAGISSLSHIEDNLGAMGWRLSPDEFAQLDDAADALRFEFKGAGFQTTDSKFVGYGFEKWALD